jgi:hypothetical protein
MDGLQLLWNAEYVATQIFIEMFWGIGKNRLGAADNQYEGRSLADVSDILHKAWLEKDTRLCSNLMRHCEVEMSHHLNRDHVKNGGPLHGNVPYIQGLPNAATLAQWKELAGMKEGDEYDPFEEQEGEGADRDDGEEDEEF